MEDREELKRLIKETIFEALEGIALEVADRRADREKIEIRKILFSALNRKYRPLSSGLHDSKDDWYDYSQANP